MQNNTQPPHITELLNKAVRYHQSGELEQAESLYKKILKADPDHSIAAHLLGVIAHQSGKHDAAIKWMKKAIAANTEQSFRFLNELGNVYKDAGDLANAAQCFQDAFALRPDYADAYYSLAVIHKLQNDVDAAASCYAKALELNSGNVEAHIEMGEYFEANNRVTMAVSCYQKVLQSDSVNPGLVNMKLGILHGKLDASSQAVVYLQKAHDLMPESAGVNYNLGLVFQKQGIFDKAVQAYRQALDINPEHTDAYINMGAIYQKQGDLDAASGHYREAIRLRPDDALICSNIGLLLKEQNKYDEATQWFEKSLGLDPDCTDCLSHYVCHLKDTCDWERLATLSGKLDEQNQKAIDGNERAPESPFSNLTRCADPALNFAIAKSWADDAGRQVSGADIHFSFDNHRNNSEPITIGYLSNNFGNHPIAHLMQNLYGLHDRDKFEINCYSYGKNDGSRYRKKIEQDCDRFIDLFDMTPLESAQRIYEDQVDILVDLVGHTENNRMIICAYRPAPLQVSWLGFPGSTGADFMDYIITDRIVTPEREARHYSEKFVYMPDSYQIHDDTSGIQSGRLKKRDFGLPEDSFIFCSFNRPYKIEPTMFDCWMSILREVDRSILWLLSGGDAAERNLRKEAKLRSVDPSRLYFSGMMPLEDHLGRLVLADMALDTSIYNGGATTSHALRAGIPVITMQGNHFLSRMSASALFATGLPELVVADTEQYGTLAVRLAITSTELKSIRAKLVKNCLSAPIFKTSRFVNNLEMAYRKMWRDYLSGKSPQQIIQL